MKSKKLWLVAVLAGVFSIITYSLFNQPQKNTGSFREIPWDTEYTKNQFLSSCADCHSYRTKWPVYSSLPLIGRSVREHVEHGREHFNIDSDSRFDFEEIKEEVLEGKMPLSSYTWLHPDAKMTDDEKDLFLKGLKKSLGNFSPTHDHDSENDKDHYHEEHEHYNLQHHQ